MGRCIYGASLDGSTEWTDVLKEMGISLEGEPTG